MVDVTDAMQQFRELRNDPDNIELRNALITEHLGIASAVAQRFVNRGESLDDLVQVARYGLVRAVERFDPDRGVSFVGYAVPTILGEIKRHFRDRTWGLKVPRSTKELLPRVKSASEELTAELGRSPKPSEIATLLGVGVDDVLEVLEAMHAYRPDSIFTSNGDGGSSSSREPGSMENRYSSVEARLTVDRLLQTLPDRERRILELRFYDERSQTDIAEEIGVSQMHVSRLLRKALMSLGAYSVADAEEAAL